MSGKRGAEYALDRLSVLVVEDSQFMRNLIESVLHSLGIRKVHLCGDAAEAFTILKHKGIDIVLVDWSMEPLDGIDFVRLVRNAKDSPNPYLPMIMISGHSEAWRIEQARDVGVNEYLAKPFTAHALCQRIQACIESPRPFVRSKTFFGPDRRRKNNGPPEGVAERRASEISGNEDDESIPEGLRW